jgi:asparagine synthase (glutamine-hydrolysing)
MSAIVGIFHRDGRPAESAAVEKMVETLAHRGPDGAGVWVEGNVGVGHRMLWTTSESINERLPLVDVSSSCVITADARIDNREELFDLLEIVENDHSKIADSELILAAYEKWGEDCLEHLLGDFAFAIWDGRRQQLFCARDHFGIKPFYYYSSDKLFAFATEVKALFAVPEIPRRLNENVVADFLAYFQRDNVETNFRDIVRLQPATCLSVSRECTRLRKYWELDPEKETRLNSDEEYAEGLRERFIEAVRCRARSAYPLGSFLSGGLDSSSITCVARDLLAKEGRVPLRTYSAVFDDVTECDERPFINAVLAQNSVKPEFVVADKINPLTDWERVIWHLDEYIFHGNNFLHWGMCGLAQKHGIRVMLDGYDGDTTVSHGAGKFIELARAGRFLELAREAREYGRHFPKVPSREVTWWHIRRYWLDPRMPELLKPVRSKARSVLRRARRKMGGGEPDARVVSFVRRDFLADIKHDQRREAYTVGRDRDIVSERQVHYRRLTWPLLTQATEQLNKIGAAFGLEHRFPFFDKRVAEYCLSLPPQQKLFRGWNRVVMRRAMEGILPKEVQWRGGKGNLTANFEYGLKSQRERLDEIILKRSEIIDRYVDMKSLKETYRKFLQDQASEAEVLALWRPVSLALWLHQDGLRP